MKLLLLPLRIGLAVLDKAFDLIGAPDIPPTPVVVLDETGPWAGWDEAL